MVTRINGLDEFNSDDIIKLLDSHFQDLNLISVSLIMENEDKKFLMKLVQKLYECGCEINISSNMNILSNIRSTIEKSDVIICKLNNGLINDTFHFSNNMLIDLSGKSVTDSFLNTHENNNLAEIMYPV